MENGLWESMVYIVYLQCIDLVGACVWCKPGTAVRQHFGQAIDPFDLSR